jgi:hypothetical protein
MTTATAEPTLDQLAAMSKPGPATPPPPISPPTLTAAATPDPDRWVLGRAGASDWSDGGRPMGWFDLPGQRDQQAKVRAELHLLHAGGMTLDALAAGVRRQRHEIEQALEDVRAQFASSKDMLVVYALEQRLSDARNLVSEAEATAKGHRAAARKALVAGDDPTPHERAARQAEGDAGDFQQRIGVLEGLLSTARSRARQALLHVLGQEQARLTASASAEVQRIETEICAAVGPLLAPLLAARERLNGLRGRERECGWRASEQVQDLGASLPASAPAEG